MKINLQKHGYPESLIINGFKKASMIPKEDLRRPKTKNEENFLAFITTENPNNPNVFPLVRNSIDTLIRKKVDGFTQTRKVIHSKRQSPNLKRLLTSSVLSRKENKVSKCGDTRCKCCDHLVISNKHTFKKTKKTFELKSPMSCNSQNLIYVIICPTCQEEYIGETGKGKTKLRDRVRVHRQHIQQPELAILPVSKHLRNCGKGNFNIFPFFQLKTNDENLRKTYETKFIKEFRPKLNMI